VNVTELKIGDLFTYRDTAVDLAMEGLTVLVGENGAGKSAMGVEVVPWVLWGETVRGMDPIPDGLATVKVGAYMVTREVRKRRLVQLLLRGSDGKDHAGQTTTETQAKINRLFGDWRRFAATRVFSRELAARFSVATNAERQKLLEGLLGLEQFTRAEKLAKAEEATRVGKVGNAKNDLNAAGAALTRARDAVKGAAVTEDVGAVRALAGAAAEELEAANVRAARADALAAAARRTWDGARDARRRRQEEVARLEKRLRSEEAEAEAAPAGGECPVCLRPVGPAEVKRVAERRRAICEATEEEIAVIRAELDAGAADVEELQEDARSMRLAADEEAQDADAARRKHGELVSRLRVAESQQADAERLRKMVSQDEARVERYGHDVLAAQARLKVAEAALRVLGRQGARVRVFAEALKRLEAGTNAVLRRLGIPAEVKVSGDRQLASGAKVEEVTMQVLVQDGDPGGQYRAASGGERTRVDVAMMLALSRLSRDTGLQVFDEVFDPLDDEGIELVADLLVEMARSRQVVVITHAQRLVDRLRSGTVMAVSKAGGLSSVEVV